MKHVTGQRDRLEPTRTCAQLAQLCGARRAWRAGRLHWRGRLGGTWRALFGPAAAVWAAVGSAPETWTYVPFEDTCDSAGGPVGLGVNLRVDADRLVILLGGGEVGASARECWLPNGWDAKKMERTWWFRGVGIFDRGDAHNPLADASYVVIPAVNYDHMGANLARYPAEPNAEDVVCVHHGAANLDAFLRRIVPTFTQVKQVVLVGQSAGGFGASYHVPRLRQAFAGKELLVINDSGPYLPPGHELFNGDKVAAWGLRKTVARGWRRMLPNAGDPKTGSWNLYDLTAELNLRAGPPVRTALITSVWDPCIAESYRLSVGAFERAVRALPEFVSEHDPDTRVFLINRPGHTWLENLRSAHSWGAPAPVSLCAFLKDFLEDGPGGHVAQPARWGRRAWGL